MVLSGNYETISNAFNELQRLAARPDMNYRINLSIEASGNEYVLADSNTLSPVDSINGTLNDCFLIQKAILETILAALGKAKLEIPQINKTEANFMETNPPVDATGASSDDMNSSAVQLESTHLETQQSSAKSPQFSDSHGYYSSGNANHKIPDNLSGMSCSLPLDPKLYIIEDHDLQCAAANRPTVFAIKCMSANYYLLFYRKSVYDSGVDNNFRKYLSMQPGTLVAYRYCHSVNSIRSEFANLNLSLRHNGKNELSRYQADHILQTFNSMLFL